MTPQIISCNKQNGRDFCRFLESVHHFIRRGGIPAGWEADKRFKLAVLGRPSLPAPLSARRLPGRPSRLSESICGARRAAAQAAQPPCCTSAGRSFSLGGVSSRLPRRGCAFGEHVPPFGHDRLPLDQASAPEKRLPAPLSARRLTGRPTGPSRLSESTCGDFRRAGPTRLETVNPLGHGTFPPGQAGTAGPAGPAVPTARGRSLQKTPGNAGTPCRGLLAQPFQGPLDSFRKIRRKPRPPKDAGHPFEAGLSSGPPAHAHPRA